MNEPELIKGQIKKTSSSLKHPVFRELEKKLDGKISQQELEMFCIDWSLKNQHLYLVKPLPEEPTQSPGEPDYDFDKRLSQWEYNVKRVRRENKENEAWIEKCKMIRDMEVAKQTGGER